MKIKFSLRLYLISAMTLLSLTLGLLYFSLTTSYFIEGLDTILQSSMIKLAETYDVEEGEHFDILDFTLSNRWEDMPENIQNNLSPAPENPGEFIKNVIKKTSPAQPHKAYFGILIEDASGKREYVARAIKNKVTGHVDAVKESLVVGTLGIGLAIALAFVCIMILMIRSITNPFDKLIQWTQNLTTATLREPAPHFRYPEMDNFAEIIRSSLLSSQQSIEREQAFLRHASHELRTPIAVIGNSTELLQRLAQNPSDKEQAVLARIERASLTMKNLTETLLWLSREHEEALPEQNVRLDALIEEITADLNYLLQGKTDVEVTLETSTFALSLPLEASRIILANLIRNAFQHTQSGRIIIKQNQASVDIYNSLDKHSGKPSEDLGFGLGLHLCRKLAKRFNWRLKIKPSVREVFIGKQKNQKPQQTGIMYQVNINFSDV